MDVRKRLGGGPLHQIIYKALNLCFLDRKKLSLSCVFKFWLCFRTSSQLELRKDELVNVEVSI